MCSKCGSKSAKEEFSFFFTLLVEDDDDMHSFFGFKSNVADQVEVEDTEADNDKIEEQLNMQLEGKVITVDYFRKDDKNRILKVNKF
jgi:hypothetical protein